LLAGAKDEKKNPELATELTKLIQETIDIRSWIDKGGKLGTIKYLAGQLIITQTKENQKDIGQLLDKLRETRSIQVTLEMRVIAAPAGLLRTADIDVAMDVNLVKRGNAAAKGAEKRKPLQGTFLDDDHVGKLIKAVQASVDARTLTAPRMTVFNGQEGSIHVGQEMPFIAGWSDLKNGKRQPQISNVKTGFISTIQPTVSADRKYVTLNLKASIVNLRKMDDIPWTKAAADEKLDIQKPDLAVVEADTLVSIPDNGNFMALLAENEEKAKDPKAIINILLIRPTILEQKLK